MYQTVFGGEGAYSPYSMALLLHGRTVSWLDSNLEEKIADFSPIGSIDCSFQTDRKETGN